MTADTRAALTASGGAEGDMPPEVALMARHFRAKSGLPGAGAAAAAGAAAGAAAAAGLDAPPHADVARHCTKMVCMVRRCSFNP